MNLSQEAVQVLLEERSRALARPIEDATANEDKLEVLAFTLAGEPCAIETRFVHEIFALADFTTVPGTPEVIFGVTNLRGSILAIVDLRKIIGVASTGLTDLFRVIVVGRARAEFGLLADKAHDVRAVPRADLFADTADSTSSGHIRGVTAEGLTVIDAAKLLEDPRLVVDHGDTLG